MTESDWKVCQEAWAMLAYRHGKVSERKQRLLAVACCRDIWHLLADERLQKAVEVAEAHADGNAGAEALSNAREAALVAWRVAYERMTGHPPPEVVSITVKGPDGQAGAIALLSGHPDGALGTYVTSPQAAATSAAAAVHRATVPARLLPSSACQLAADAAAGRCEGTKYCPAETAAQAVLVRDLLGNPWHPVAISPFVLAWQNGTVACMAEAIYESRRWEDMPRLGDALEEAGCTDRAVLDHCRGPGHHARGCHVLDAILGLS